MEWSIKSIGHRYNVLSMSENWNIYEIRARHERGEISDGEFARLSLNRGLGFLGFSARPAKLKLSDFTDENMDSSKQLQMARACGYEQCKVVGPNETDHEAGWLP